MQQHKKKEQEDAYVVFKQKMKNNSHKRTHPLMNIVADKYSALFHISIAEKKRICSFSFPSKLN